MPVEVSAISVPGLQIAAGALRSLSLRRMREQEYRDHQAWEIISKLSRIGLTGLQEGMWGITGKGAAFVALMGGPYPQCAWPDAGQVTAARLAAFGFNIIPAGKRVDEGRERRRVPGTSAGTTSGSGRCFTDAHYTETSHTN